MNDQGIEQRLREALKSAGAEIAPHGVRPPGLEVRTRERRARWQLAAAVAAAAVTLAFGVPFALLNKANFDPAAFEAPKDPPPLERVVPPPPSDFFLDLAWSGGRFSPYPVVAATSTQPNEFYDVSSYRSAAAAPDRRSFYLVKQDSATPVCSTRINKISVHPQTMQVSQTTVEGTVAPGRQYSSIAISPDGSKLAVWYDAVRWNGRRCVVNAATTHGVLVFDLASGAKHAWTLPTMSGVSAPVGINALSWSLDNRYLAFPSDFPKVVPLAEVLIGRGKTALMPDQHTPSPTGEFRYLDTTRPDGALVGNSREIKRSDELASYSSVQLLTSNQYYPPALTGFAPQGGARVLAVAMNPDKTTRALLEIRLGSGSVSVLDPSYNPNILSGSW